VPAPRLNRRLGRSRSRPCDTGSVVRTAQVTGLLTSRVVGTVPARYLKGPPQVHHRSVRGQRSWPCHGLLETGSSMAGHCILQTRHGPGRHGPLPGVIAQMKRRTARRHRFAPVEGDTPISAGVLATARGSRGSCVGQNMLTSSDRPGEPGGLFTEDGGPLKSGSKRFGEPLAPAGFRPPYVRNHCRAAASPDRR
jgi:hypothetical protein